MQVMVTTNVYKKIHNKKKNNKINQTHTLSLRTDCKPYTCPDYKSGALVHSTIRDSGSSVPRVTAVWLCLRDISGEESGVDV